MSKLFVIYRSTGPDRFPRRPAYFDKLLCLKSFLLSYRAVRDQASILFLNDGPVPEDRLAVMRRWGGIVELPGLGNGPSFRRAVESALAMPDDTIAYFAEDDYLYLEPAIQRLTAAFAPLRRADFAAVRLAARPRGRPKEHLMWRWLQGQKLFAWKFPKRMLLGPVPSLATHMDTQSLAPVVDWAAVARTAAAAPLD